MCSTAARTSLKIGSPITIPSEGAASTLTASLVANRWPGRFAYHTPVRVDPMRLDRNTPIPLQFGVERAPTEERISTAVRLARSA